MQHGLELLGKILVLRRNRADGGKPVGDLGSESRPGKRSDPRLIPHLGNDFAYARAGLDFQPLAQAEHRHAQGGEFPQGFPHMLHGQGDEQVVRLDVRPMRICMGREMHLMIKPLRNLPDGPAPGTLAENEDGHVALLLRFETDFRFRSSL